MRNFLSTLDRQLSIQKHIQFGMMCISSLPVLYFFGILLIKTNVWTFRCDDGEIISDRLFCNGYKNCNDRSDESYGCSKKLCGRQKFKCQSSLKCIAIKNRCDSINDCDDGSDETNCGAQSPITNLDNCQLLQGKFLCKNKLACIDFSMTCDEKCHCLDCSDENSTNCAKFDSNSCSSCIHSCLPTPDGPRCICNSSDESSPICKDIQNCTKLSNCSQHCTRYGNFQRCLCYKGFHEIRGSNGKECQKNLWLQTILLYSTVNRIKLINFSRDAIDLVQNDVLCTALAASRDHVYFAEFRNNRASIYKSFIGDGGREEIVKFDSRITSISVDWVTENVYFTNNDSLFVCSRNGGICTRLKCCGINDVVLAPKHGKMFYIQYAIVGENEQLIMKSNMDGSEENYLLPDESFQFRFTIAFDEYKDRLYWTGGAERKLFSIALDGTIQYYDDKNFWGLPIWYISVFDERAFTANQRKNIVYGMQTLKIDGYPSRQEYPDNSTSYMRNLYVHNPSLQRTDQVKNVCSDAPCTGLCLTRSSSNGLNYTCLCENFTPVENNHWCDKDKEYPSHQIEYPSTSNEPYSETTNNAYSSSVTTGLPETTRTLDEVDVWPNLDLSPEPYQINNTKQERHHLDEPSAKLSKTYDYVVIYSTATKIKAWYVANDTHRVIQSGVESTALAGVRENIYYGSFDHQSHIFKIDMTSGQTKELVRMATPITSISVDWITNNIYFTSNMSLSVCSPDGIICTELKCCGIGQVTVTSRFQWMFYTQKMSSSDMYLIMISGLDGSGENILLDNGFSRVASLTVDESNEMVYWTDMNTGSYMLHSVSFDGSRKRSTDKMQYTSSEYVYMAILEKNLFYVDRDENIEWENLDWSRSYRDEETNLMKYLHVFNPALQNANEITNPCKQWPCPGLCLLSSKSRKNFTTTTCICEDFTPTYENHWCDKNHRVPELKSNTVRKIEITTSTEPMTNFTSKQVLNSENCSSISVIAASMRSLQSDYLVPSGVLGFILGMISTFFVMGVRFIVQKYNRKKHRAEYLINDINRCTEMEM